jgi:hypothetical protein
MQIKNRVRAAAAAVAFVAGIGCGPFAQGGLASAGTRTAAASAAAASSAAPDGPGGTWGQALAIPGVAALATGGTQAQDGVATALSCTSPGNCTAVGSYSVYDPKSNTYLSWPLVVSESGGAWWQAARVQGIASLSSGLGGQLAKISCASAGNCSAAGTYNGPGNTSFAFLVDEVNGIWGAAQALPDAGSLSSPTITALSCPSAGDCSAVGGPSGTPFILDEVNGTWGNPLVVPGLASPGAPAQASSWSLDSLSCPAAGYCTAVGTARSTSREAAAFVVTQTDGAWGNAALIPGQAALSATQESWSDSVSCTAVGDCTAIGGYNPGSGYNWLMWTADEVNGTWGAAQQLARPAATLRMTGSLSCATPGNCAVGGTYRDARGLPEVFVANEVNGTWQPSEDVPGLSGTASYADAISCAAPGDCAAMGSYQVSGRWQEYAVDEVGGTWGTARALPGVTTAVPQIDGLSCTAPGYCSAVGYLTGNLFLVGEATGTATTATVAAATVTYGNEQAVPVTVTVSSAAGGTPTGTVTVTATPPYTGVTACTVTLTAGTGSCMLPATLLAAGTYQLTATYNGDTTYAASASATTAALTVTPAATTTSLALSATKAPYGHESVVRVSAVTTPQWAGVVTGFVNVQLGDLLICQVNLTAGRGSCVLPDTALRVGTRHLTGHAYPGGSFTASVSASRSVVIVKGSDSTTLTLSKAVVSYGHEHTEKLSVRVSPRYHGTPGGRVVVKADTGTLCVIILRARTGSCVLAARQLRAGTYRLVASYEGNVSFGGSASRRKSLKVTP